MKTNAIFSLENILTDFFRPIYVDVQASTLVKNKYIISLSANGLDNTISSHKKVMQVFKEYINNTSFLLLKWA